MQTAAGVDGCKAGWVAAVRRPGEIPSAAIWTRIEHLADALPPDAAIVVDMPIGLPDFIHGSGRGPEMAVRPLLGPRQSSVFSIPSRAAVYAETAPFTTLEEWDAAHRRASAVARATSDPPRAISIQAFGIFSKIREIDELLRRRPELRARLVESHPEVAFWRLNGDQAMSLPKKIKGRVNPAGMTERRTLLAQCGLDRPFLDQPPPRGASDDDFLDACAMLLVAERVAQGLARPYPALPLADAFGIPIAIRV
jgi:predicted RNase H-like nuclease